MNRRKLTLFQYAEIREAVRIRKTLRTKELAKRYKVSPSLIQAIQQGRRLGVHG